MAASLVWTCPIDGLSVSAMLTEQAGDPQTDQHIHFVINEQRTCANLVTPHTWRIKTEFVVERVN